jgi:histone acetyltransferase
MWQVRIPGVQWHGYIKDYDGGTLMESVLHRELPYTDMARVIIAQKEALDQRLGGLSTAHILYPGLHIQDDLPLLTPAEVPGTSHT